MSLDDTTFDQPATPDQLRQRLVGAGALSTALRIVRGVGWSLISLGLLMLGFVAHQLWITDFFADRAQASLESDLAALVAEGAEVVPYNPQTGEIGEPVGIVPAEIVEDSGALTEAIRGLGDPSTTPEDFSIAGADRFLLRETAPAAGAPVGTIRIPDISVKWTVVEGVRRNQLRKGAGHMPETPVPGQPGNAVISGHRTTYGAPFHNLDDLEVGDSVFWDSPIGTHEFVVREAPLVVQPTDLWVTNPREGAWITLTTCHPKFSARQRLIVFAEMVAGPNAPVIYGST